MINSNENNNNIFKVAVSNIIKATNMYLKVIAFNISKYENKEITDEYLIERVKELSTKHNMIISEYSNYLL
jgi:hypothetical protein